MDSSVPSKTSKPAPKPKQAIAAKIFHWVNIISLLLMITSGLQIYNANPVFGGRVGWHFPPLFVLGGWLAGGRHWHFAAMWFFALNLLWYGLFIFITRRWKQRFLGSNDLKALQRTHNAKRKNYAWHRLAYTVIIPVLLLALLSGLGMYKPAQFHWIVDLFGSWQALRIVHFISVPSVVIFAVIHSWLGLKGDIASALHPQTLMAYQKNGQPLKIENGAPLRLASGIKLGYKQSKWVTRITLTSKLLPARGYWEDRGYEWFAGL